MSESTTTVPTGVSETRRIVLDNLGSLIAEANKRAEVVKNSTENRGKVVHEILKSSDDETVAKWRKSTEALDKKREDLRKAVEEYVRTNLLPSAQKNEDGTPVDVEAIKAEYQTFKETVNGTVKYLKTMGVSAEDIKASAGDLLSLRGTSSGTGKGEGGKKPRLSEVTVNGTPVFKAVTNDDGTTENKASFTYTAEHLTKTHRTANPDSKVKVATGDLQQAAFETANTTDLSELAGRPIEFKFSVEGTDYDLVVTPKDSSK